MATKHFFWQNAANPGTTDPLINAIVTSATNPAPTLATEGTALPGRKPKLMLSFVSSIAVGDVVFRIWHHVAGAGWILEDAIGAAGTVTIAAVTDPQRAIILEYPGSRIYVEILNVALPTLTMHLYEGIES
jgi:hypothetical protein